MVYIKSCLRDNERQCSKTTADAKFGYQEVCFLLLILGWVINQGLFLLKEDCDGVCQGNIFRKPQSSTFRFQETFTWLGQFFKIFPPLSSWNLVSNLHSLSIFHLFHKLEACSIIYRMPFNATSAWVINRWSMLFSSATTNCCILLHFFHKMCSKICLSFFFVNAAFSVISSFE